MVDLTTAVLSMLVFSFSITCLLAGAFTAYFGAGRSRSIGFAIICLGIIGVIILLWFSGFLGESVSIPEGCKWNSETVIEGIVGVIGAVIGLLLAMGVFLGAIMKA